MAEHPDDIAPDHLAPGGAVTETRRIIDNSNGVVAIHRGAELVVPLLEHGLIEELLLLVSPSDVG